MLYSCANRNTKSRMLLCRAEPRVTITRSYNFRYRDLDVSECLLDISQCLREMSLQDCSRVRFKSDFKTSFFEKIQHGIPQFTPRRSHWKLEVFFTPPLFPCLISPD